MFAKAWTQATFEFVKLKHVKFEIRQKKPQSFKKLAKLKIFLKFKMYKNFKVE